MTAYFRGLLHGIRGIRPARVVVAATATHLIANAAVTVALLLPGAVPVRDALALPILLVVGTAVAARRVARSGAPAVAPLHGLLVGGLVGLVALAYGPVSGLLVTILAVATGWLSTAQPAAPAPPRQTPAPPR